MSRILKYNIPGVEDQYVFDKIDIQRSNYPFHFNLSNPVSIEIPERYRDKRKYDDFDSFLRQKNTLAFILVRNDSILFEKYFNDTQRDSTLPSFSVSKSFVSAMIGIAIEDKFIENINDPINKYVTDFRVCNFENITIEKLLNMCSGLKTNGLMKGAPRIYYSEDLSRDVQNYYFDYWSYNEFNYENVNTLLLTMALQEATGVSPAEYLEKKIWQASGMNYDASWSVDSKENNCVKGFCGINAAPLDLAIFGRLYMENGKFNDMQVIPEEWVRQSLTIHNDSKDDYGHFYSYHWRITKSGGFAASGLLGQYIYVYPPEKIIIVRMGNSLNNFDWISFLEEVAMSL